MKRLSESAMTSTPMSQKGAGMIEVLISVLVLSIGLLGIAAMQALALRNSQSSLERSQAVMQTFSIMDAMRANRAAALAGAYNLPLAEDSCTAPTGDGRIDKEKNDWLDAIEDAMGEGACGGVQCQGGKCTVTIRWNDSRGSGGVAEQEIETEVVI